MPESRQPIRISRASALRFPLEIRRRNPRRRGSDHQPQRGLRVTLLITAAVALADWSSKAAIIAFLPRGGFTELVPDRLALWHVRNQAMVLGLWSDLPLATRQSMALLAALLAVLLLIEIVPRTHRFSASEQRWAWLFAGCAFGGMLGNLGERLVHRGVTDFLSFGWNGIWLPPGNIADIALLLSFPLALPVFFFEMNGRARRGSGAATPERQIARIATPVSPAA